MPKKSNREAPAGGLQANPRSKRGWQWPENGPLESAPVRCKREQWYLLRAKLREPGTAHTSRMLVRFIADELIVDQRGVTLAAAGGDAAATELYGWVLTPDDCRELQLCFEHPGEAAPLLEIAMHPIAERDPKCHPLANVPRWSTYQPPLKIERVLLPATLRPIAEQIGDGVTTEVISRPPDLDALLQAARGCACVLDPDWVTPLGLTLADLELLAANTWLVIDLETLARVLKAADAAKTQIEVHTSEHDVMSARVDYADVPTRGFAMQDVLPYSYLTPKRHFGMRTLKATGSYKRYADEAGLATLLKSETPWEKKSGDVLMAARPVEQGELIATDLPWLAAGSWGPLLAPQLTTHLLRMLFGIPLDDHVEYWNRWDDTSVMLRDIADLPRRFGPLRIARWHARNAEMAHLGVSLADPEGDTPTRHILLSTGRIDRVGVHDGVPPEAMIILMKTLAREIADQTDFAQQHLAGTRLTWQFDTADALEHVVEYDSAGQLSGPTTPTAYRLRHPLNGPLESLPPAKEAGYVDEIVLNTNPGIFGDGSLALQAELTRKVHELLKHAAPRQASAPKANAAATRQASTRRAAVSR